MDVWINSNGTIESINRITTKTYMISNKPNTAPTISPTIPKTGIC